MLSLYVNDGFGYDYAVGSEQMYAVQIPWMRDHFLDPSIPGSLRAEIAPTAAYMQAIWDRLHDRFDEADLVIHTWPDAPRRLRESDHASVASWVTMVFGKGVHDGSATGSIVSSGGDVIPVSFADNRWANGTSFSRLVRFRAEADYVPGETYTATMSAGRPLIDGTTTSEHSFTFQVECADASDERCPPLPTIHDPLTEPAPESAEDGCSVAGGGSGPGVSGAALVAAFALVAARSARRRFVG